MIEEADITAVGKFQKTHALKGELNAILDVDPEFLEEGNALIVEIDGIYVPFFAESIRPKGATSFLIKLDGIDSENDARQFINKNIYAMKRQLAPFLDIEEDEIHNGNDLIGYKIIDMESGNCVGRIIDIDDSTQNLLFIVKNEEGSDIFIPAADELIAEIDDDDQSITMHIPHGLTSINQKKLKE